MSTTSVNPASHDRFDNCSQIHSSTRSQVWKCWDKCAESWIALKSSAASPPEEVVELLRRVDHPNIVQAIGTEALRTPEAGIKNVLLLQFVPGQPITQLVTKQSPLPETASARILLECSRGLSALHSSGIVHGDIAPANVIVDEQLARATLIDLEQGASAQRTSAHRSRGTPVTMSPEVASGQPPTPLSDIYSLGCLAYFMLTGTHVFSGATSLEICWKQKSHPCPSLQSDPGSTRPKIHSQLASLVDRMLAKQPSQRPDSAAQIADHLSSLAD